MNKDNMKTIDLVNIQHEQRQYEKYVLACMRNNKSLVNIQHDIFHITS